MSAWDEARLGGRAGSRFALGLWHPLYKLASLAWVPPASQRLKLRGKQRYVYIFNFDLSPGQSDSARITTTQDFYPTDIATSLGGQSFSAQLFETRTKTRYMDFPIWDSNVASAFTDVDSQVEGGREFTMPFFFRRIARIPKGSVLQMTVANNNATEAFQIALGGYQG